MYLTNAFCSTQTTMHKLTSKHLRINTSFPDTSATTISKFTDVMMVFSLSAALMLCTTSHICYPRDMQHLRSHQRLVTFINLIISMILVHPCTSFLVLKKCLSQLRCSQDVTLPIMKAILHKFCDALIFTFSSKPFLNKLSLDF